MSIKKKLWKVTFFLMLSFLALTGCGKKKEEEYRQIQVYKIDGTTMVERQGSDMEAYDNMQLQSGDIIETKTNSSVQLKLDEDKYILVEPDSKISLQATGNSVDSKTTICLEKGAIVNQLDNPLSKESSYQVTTQNSTMAVRGTTFRVEITYDENGESHTKIAVYGGKVECNLVFPDGTVTEPVMVEAGSEVLIWGDDVDSEYIGSGNISYEEMQEMVIDFLSTIIDNGKQLSVTKEELAAIKEGLVSLTKEEKTEEDIVDEEAEDEKSVAEESVDESADREDDSNTEQGEDTQEETATEETEKEKTQPSTSGGESGSGDSGNSGGGSGGGTPGGGSSEKDPDKDEPGKDEPGTDEPGTDEPGKDEPGTDEPGTDEPGKDEPGTDEPGTDEPETDEPPKEEPVEEKCVKIKFYYGSVLYAWTEKTILVTDEAIIIKKPTLQPSARGWWSVSNIDGAPTETSGIGLKMTQSELAVPVSSDTVNIAFTWNAGAE